MCAYVCMKKRMNVDKNTKKRRKKAHKENIVLMLAYDEHHISVDSRHINYNKFENLMK